MAMDVTDFFRASAGRWFSQRNRLDLTGRRAEGGRSEVEIACLAADDPRAVGLCRLGGIDPERAAGALLIEWKGALDFDTKTYAGRSLLVSVPDAPGSEQGDLVAQNGAGGEPMVGRFRMGEDDALTLLTCQGAVEIKERLLFASPNLRLRASVVTGPDGLSVTTFCSEVRRAEAPPAQQSPQTQARTWPSQTNELPDWITEEMANKGDNPEV